MDNELDRHSPISDVLKLLFEGHQNLTDLEYCYDHRSVDILSEKSIHKEEVEVIINLLSHTKLSAVEIADILEEHNV